MQPQLGHRTIILWVVLALWLLAGIAIARPASAHGGGVIRLSAVAAGPYRVTVWTAPGVIRAATPLHVTVAVADTAERPVLDAAVLVQLFAAGAATPALSAEATTAQSTNRLFYEADISPPAIGPHRIAVALSGPEGEGTVDFNVDIEPPAGTNWLLVGLAVLVFIAIVALFKGSQAEAPARRKQVTSTESSPAREDKL